MLTLHAMLATFERCVAQAGVVLRRSARFGGDRPA